MHLNCERPIPGVLGEATTCITSVDVIFLHQLGLVMRCWNLTGNCACFIIFPPTISGQSRNRQRQGRRWNCTTKSVATEDEWIHCPRVGSQLPRSCKSSYISSSLDTQSDTAILPGSPGNCGLKDMYIPIFPNNVIEKPKMCQRTLKMPRHIERHGCRNLNVWLLGPQKSPDFWGLSFFFLMETICLQTRTYTQKTHHPIERKKRHLTIKRFFVSCGLDFIFLWLPFFQPELPDLLMSPIKATAPNWLDLQTEWLESK